MLEVLVRMLLDAVDWSGREVVSGRLGKARRFESYSCHVNSCSGRGHYDGLGRCNAAGSTSTCVFRVYQGRSTAHCSTRRRPMSEKQSETRAEERRNTSTLTHIMRKPTVGSLGREIDIFT